MVWRLAFNHLDNLYKDIERYLGFSLYYDYDKFKLFQYTVVCCDEEKIKVTLYEFGHFKERFFLAYNSSLQGWWGI